MSAKYYLTGLEGLRNPNMLLSSLLTYLNRVTVEVFMYHCAYGRQIQDGRRGGRGITVLMDPIT